MFRHQGRTRTLRHNLRIATFLAFVAGIVNVTGFLFFKQLTTHVTGHFSQFINDVADLEFWKGTIYFLYIFSFLFGSFSSSFLIIKFRKNKQLNVFFIPTLIECLILTSIGLLSNVIEMKSSDLVVCLLLFAMGLQNSFVTKISNAVVRTTHLTGLFTDLGIEISQMFFPKLYPNREKLKANIILRIYIISFFFAGGLVGGFFYAELNWKLNTLIFGAFILLISLFYNNMRYGFLKAKRRIKQKQRYKTNNKLI
ncbi:YoaK family protein [Hwangdonia lutea]|uniref:YoaK family protein n=1 Tax=Hwangdonia lutea TaxID=3075823 RepID=A0AA97HSN1_9FLAO|nr:YoaK family protein [Hwangdonia sp. SCSIO 19198]WOD45300.1 YoaK family protein [Hwangdonia sp. SCSIO 19198]